MAKLFVPTTTNFGDQSLSNIDTIEFTNVGAGWGTTATFANSQFNNGNILDNVLIDGNTGIQRIAVFGGSVDASGWKFKDWGSEDAIVLDGRSTNDRIIGSSQVDTINGAGGNDQLVGGLGADTLNGGEGNDSFHYFAGSELATGETINGGLGLDAIKLTNTGSLSATTFNLRSVETIDFVSGNSLFHLQVNNNPPPDPEPGFRGITTVDGGAGSDQFSVAGALINLGAVTFTNWSAADTIRLQGTGGVDFLTGSAQADTIFGFASDDTILGGAGADTIVGGAGRDRLTGGAQRDVFDFNHWSESPVAMNGVFAADIITDFLDPVAVTSPQEDIIDLSGIDANEAAAGDQAFVLDNGNNTFDVGELVFRTRVNAEGVQVSVIFADVNNDRTPDFAIEFDRVLTGLDTGDFVL